MEMEAPQGKEEQAMTHDPLCPFAPWPDEHCYQPDAGVSVCSIIAKVREDMPNSTQILGLEPRSCVLEYEAGVAAGRAEALSIRVREVMPYANGYLDGEDHMLAKCIEAVRPVAEFQIRFAANLWSCDPMNCELCDCGMDSAGRQQIADTARSQTEMVLDALRALQEKP